LLARDGYDIVVADVVETASVVEEISAGGGRASGTYLDLRIVGSFDSILDRLAGQPPLGALVIAAALMGPITDLPEYRLEDWQRVVDVNITGTFFLAQAVANRMAAAGGGRVVFFGSASGRTPGKSTIAPYNVTKAAIPALVHTFAMAYKGTGVLFAAVDPGRVLSALTRDLYPDPTMAVTPDLPMGRTLQPDEVAEVVSFLCSPRANGVTAAIWGVSARP
jgi:3-oxoacyl-[acyl-carrier protein] reductase